MRTPELLSDPGLPQRRCRQRISRNGALAGIGLLPALWVRREDHQVDARMGSAPGPGWLPSAGLPPVTRTCGT